MMMEPFRDRVPVSDGEHRTSQSSSDRDDFVPLLMNGGSNDSEKATTTSNDKELRRRCNKFVYRYRWAFVIAGFIALIIASEGVRLVLYSNSNRHSNNNNNPPQDGPESSHEHANMGHLEHRPQAQAQAPVTPVMTSATTQGSPSPGHKEEEWTEDECTTWPADNDGGWNATNSDTKIKLDTHAPPGGWKKPSGIKVVAVIFYGRRRNVDILDCYLQQNLVHNGGYLDEVRFFKHTVNHQDLEYLHRLTSEVKGYRMVDPYICDYSCMWAKLVEDNTIYIKIDDDVLYIHHDAIPQLVHTRIKEQHPLAVSANLVNAPVTGLEHFHFGAIHPFVPAPVPSTKPPPPAKQPSWRPSQTPLYPKDLPQTNFSVFPDPPYAGHTWHLLAGDNSRTLQESPAGVNFHRNAGLHDLFIQAYQSWAIGAQQQYSLLRNIELNQISRYFFGTRLHYLHANGSAIGFDNDDKDGPGAEQLFDTQYKRTNVIFLAMWGHDIRAALPLGEDDELALTIYKPLEMRRPFVVDTRAVILHYSFGSQFQGMRKTDLLDRWRALANEIACPVKNQKGPWDERCPGI